jgi:hypothetical protein
MPTLLHDEDGNIIPASESSSPSIQKELAPFNAAPQLNPLRSPRTAALQSSPPLPPLQHSAPKSNSEEFHNNSKYAGDLIDKSATPLHDNQFTNCSLPFLTSAQLLAFFDRQINSGEVTIWPWQQDVSKELCIKKATSQHPIRYVLVAANGSGKDAFVIAPFVIWFCLTKIKSRCIVTSSSGTQLTAQTEGYIRSLALKVNEFFGEEYFRVRQRYIKCRQTGSEIRMFATDEAGKAEGYHPMEPGAEMAIVVNESKSIDETIHEALRRCTGYTHWLEVSSPGEPKGFFYNAVTNPSMKFTSRRITSYDCPHLNVEDREADKVTFGEHSSFYRSKHLALFTSLGGDVIIPSDIVEHLLLYPPSHSIPSWPRRIGIDLAAGGDESVIVICQGCRLLKEYFCREQDTTLTADWIDQKLRDNKIDMKHEYIFADDGGVGRAIIDNLKLRGWNIKRVLNQSAAILKRQYGNRGAELWYNVKRIIEEQLFDITSCSRILLDQLTTRKNKTALQGARVFLEAKKEAKANGRPSPDRADAFVLSFCGLTIESFLSMVKPSAVVNDKTRERAGSNPEDVEQYYADNVTYSKHTPLVIGKKGRVYNSLQSALSKN